MKNYIVLLVFLFSAAASAQYRSNNGPGVDRRLSSQTPRTESKKTEKPDVVELSIKKLDEELKLDSFQSAVIRQLLEESQEKQTKIIEEDIPDESKNEKIIVLRLKLDEKIREVLTPEQIVLLDNMKKKKKK